MTVENRGANVNVASDCLAPIAAQHELRALLDATGNRRVKFM
jgi:hypothetical protein